MARPRKHAPSGSDTADHRVRSPAATTDRLLEAAADEFIKRDYEAARVNDIARRAGVTAGAVYGRWPHKSDVLVAAVSHIFEKILPEQELENCGAADANSLDKLSLLGGSLLAYDRHRDVVTQVFGSARNSEAIQERLLEYLDEEVQQLSRLIEQMKDDGFIDAVHSTTAITFLCQALGIGTNQLIAARRDERHVPSEDEWNALLAALIGALSPPIPN